MIGKDALKLSQILKETNCSLSFAKGHNVMDNVKRTITESICASLVRIMDTGRLTCSQSQFVSNQM